MPLQDPRAHSLIHLADAAQFQFLLLLLLLASVCPRSDSSSSLRLAIFQCPKLSDTSARARPYKKCCGCCWQEEKTFLTRSRHTEGSAFRPRVEKAARFFGEGEFGPQAFSCIQGSFVGGGRLEEQEESRELKGFSAACGFEFVTMQSFNNNNNNNNAATLAAKVSSCKTSIEWGIQAFWGLYVRRLEPARIGSLWRNQAESCSSRLFLSSFLAAFFFSISCCCFRRSRPRPEEE